MSNTKYFIFITLSIFLIINSFSQLAGADVDDFQVWSSVEVSYKLNKKWSFKLEEQLRLKDDTSVTDQHFTEVNTVYSVFKNVELGLGGRYIYKNDTEGNKQGYENYFRFHLDGAYKHKIERFSFKYRFRYQNKNELGADDTPIIHTRFKTSVGYNIKGWKFDPKISGEIFKRFEAGEDNRFNKYRVTFEAAYKANNIGVVLFYRLDKELNILNAETTKIIGVKLSYNFKSK